MVRTAKTLTITAVAVTSFLITLAGCDVRVLYGPGSDGTTVKDDGLLTVVSPDGDELYSPGDPVFIEWSGSVSPPTVTIDLYRYGQYLMPIAETLPNAGRLTWTIPIDFDALTEVPDEYQVSVRAQHPDHSPGDLFVQAFSEPFAIVPPATGGLSDVAVSQRVIAITLTDNGQEIDGDTVDIRLNGTQILTGHVLVGPPGTELELVLQAGSNVLEIVAVNEGSISPNTAELGISNVVDGEALQEWRLLSGESGSLTITAP